MTLKIGQIVRFEDKYGMICEGPIKAFKGVERLNENRDACITVPGVIVEADCSVGEKVNCSMTVEGLEKEISRVPQPKKGETI
tara:strand:- start:13817 stop:14065 length:249 start_codon:yes stop_codon:yes gene_type:complete